MNSSSFVAAAIVAAVILIVSPTAAGTHGLATINSPPYAPSACYGFYPPVNADMSAAANEGTLWKGGAACGKKFRVKCIGATNLGDTHPCTGASVVVTIIDKCPLPGCNGDLDIAHYAFIKIAHPGAGKIKVSYEPV